MDSTQDYVLVQSGDDWEYAPSYTRQRKDSPAGLSFSLSVLKKHVLTVFRFVERYLLLCVAVLAMASLSLFATVASHASAAHRGAF